MWSVNLTGGVALIFNICVLLTASVIILLGTWCIFNFFIWEVLLKWSFRFLKMYKLFVHFLIYRKRYFEWVKKYEGKIEEGAND
jgi:hypothetical protein